MFDREEVEAVAAGLQLLNRTGDQDLQAAARRVAAKIAGVLPELRADELDDGRFVVSDFGTPAAADMGMLRSAVRDNRRLALVYRDERERPDRRTMLAACRHLLHGEVTVLAAWCELRDNFRHFRARSHQKPGMRRARNDRRLGPAFFGDPPRLAVVNDRSMFHLRESSWLRPPTERGD